LRQFLVGRDQTTLHRRHIGKAAVELRAHLGVVQAALRLRHGDAGAVQSGCRLIHPGLCGFHRRRGADAALLQIDLTLERTFAQIGLFAGGGQFILGQSQRAGGFAPVGLGVLHVGLGAIKRRLGVRRVDPQQQVTRLHLCAFLEIRGEFDHRAAGRGPDVECAAALNLPEGGQHRGHGFGPRQIDVDGKDPLALRRHARFGVHAVLHGVAHQRAGKDQQGQSDGNQKQPGQALPQKTHVVSDPCKAGNPR